jgi:hypothetical protein
MRVPRIRASPRHGGASSVYAGLMIPMVLIRRGGVPSGVAAFIAIDFTGMEPITRLKKEHDFFPESNRSLPRVCSTPCE